MAGGKKRRSIQPPAPQSEDTTDFLDDDDENMAPKEENRIPEGQVQLTEEQLGEVYTKTITAADPNIPKKKTRFDYTEMEFIQVNLSGSDHTKVHFSMDGNLILADSDVAREQQTLKSVLEAKSKIEAENEGSTTKENDEGEYPADVLSGKLALKNQFNFSERATQTFNNPLRTKDVSTEPPPKKNYCAQVSKWTIHDEYLKELKNKMLAASVLENKKTKLGAKGDDEQEVELARISETKENVDADAQIFASKEMYRAMQLMERMVHTNAEYESFHDYKYFEDKSESKREDGRGSFLPLWKFMYEGAQRKTVTTICWNPGYTDLFAVGYGSYQFVRQSGGLICCFSLKNTSHPEYVFKTQSGVMSLDFHPEHTSLLCVGLYDGSVCVYDVRAPQTTPIYESTDPNKKHTDPVWQVAWKKPAANDELSFYSTSSDGNVSLWILSPHVLKHEKVKEIILQSDGTTGGETVEGEEKKEPSPAGHNVGLAGPCAIDFNKKENYDHLFLVGTEEGAIYSYNNMFHAEFLRSFEGHFMAVYSVKWNPFHPKVFLSCSADWTVKLWEVNSNKPILTFDLEKSVGDIAWAPYSSTVFAVITSDGKVRVYDLSVNKHDPVGEYKVGRKAKLTHITFNPDEPIICVGDDRGVIQILKLSTNLRKMTASELDELDHAAECARLDEVMIVPEDEREEDINALLEKAVQDA